MVGGCQILAGIVLGDTRNYKIWTKDEGLIERGGTKSCVMLASKGEIHKGLGWKRIREECVFDCGQGFMEEGVLRSRRSRGFRKATGFLL